MLRSPIACGWGVKMLLLLGLMLAPWGEFASTATAQNANQPRPADPDNPFPGRFPAPSLDGGVEWLNCAGPISLQDLRGKIVLLDFWTYCCINCIHVLPDLKFLEEKYADQLVVIGVHSAKFENEKDTENIREAIVRYGIAHPVVNDANFIIARKYGFRSWPTLVLIDPEGNFVGSQPGEGTRDLFDHVIGKLVEVHRKKGTLDETPVKFNLEREKQPVRPLRYPSKILVDHVGERIFICDSSHNRIISCWFDGKLIDTIGTGEIGAKDGGYDEATFDHPHGMALQGNTLYVADTENHLIRTIDLDAKQVSTFAGTGVQSRSRDTKGNRLRTALNSPWDLVFFNNVLYIAMAGPHQIWRIGINSDTIELYAGNAHEDIVDGPVKSSSLAQPSGIVTDGKALYFVDSEGSAVREIRNNRVNTLVGPRDLPQGRALFEFGDIDGIGDAARLQHPIGLTYHDGNLYIADSYNHKVKLVNIEKREATSWLGTGETGDSLDPVQMNELAGLAVLQDRYLLIADTNNHRILKSDLKTKETSLFTIDGLGPPAPPKTAQAVELAEGAAERLPAVTVRPSETLEFVIDFTFEGNYKLNKLAPVAYQLKAKGSQNLIAAELLDKRKRAEADELQATISVPLAAGAGEATLELSIAYQYCRDGVGGVCRFATKKWEIPVKLSPQGTARTIDLTTSP